MTEININKIIEISKKAGKAILEIYNDESKFNVVDYKADDSPLTIADQQSHEIIDAELKKLYPDIPVLSEEGKNISYEERKIWEKFWLVDPLDGTKEFIKRNDEFTVNIALIDGEYPILGVIYAPVLDTLYYGLKDDGTWKIKDGKTEKLISDQTSAKGIAVRSRSHASPEEDKIYKEYNISEFISVGSSLKFCMVAEGKAQLYYRHGPTMEWDTGAGQAIVESAGFNVISNKTNQRFHYNKESLLNPGFLVR
jgi:3'(2'), 5'-bisphosphate nucleotidase